MNQILRLKKKLSYLFDIQIDKANTSLNPSLDLSLRNGRLYLTTANAVYSFDDLYGNFLKAFQQIDFSKNRFDDILVLGFGMGSVPYILECVFHQRFNCLGIEADSKIVEWANQYAVPEFSNPIKIIHADALKFVESAQTQFDLLVVDIFLDDIIPANFSTTDFLEKCSSLLNREGLLLFNRLSDTETALKTTQLFFENQFKHVFPNAQFLDVGGNWILASKPIFSSDSFQ